MLYRMIVEYKSTGHRQVIYGHATLNVIEQYWAAYANKDTAVIIETLSSREIQKLQEKL